MSLLVCVAQDDFIVVAADSKAVKVEDGRVVSIGDHQKFWTVGGSDIVVGSTGSLFTNRMLLKLYSEIEHKCGDNPELFGALEYVTPRFVQILNPIAAEHKRRWNAIDATELGDVGKSTALLCGYDAAQNRMRAIYWNKDLQSEDCIGRIVVLGYPKAVELVTEISSKQIEELGDVFSPEDVSDVLKNAIHFAAKECPDYIGGEIKDHVITTPKFKEKLEQMNQLLVNFESTQGSREVET